MIMVEHSLIGLLLLLDFIIITINVFDELFRRSELRPDFNAGLLEITEPESARREERHESGGCGGCRVREVQCQIEPDRPLALSECYIITCNQLHSTHH